MMIVYHFLPKMQEYGFGRIVNTTSGIRLEPEQAGYSASKAALDKVTMDDDTPLFDDVSLSEVKQSRGGGHRFDIEAKFKAEDEEASASGTSDRKGGR